MGDENEVLRAIVRLETKMDTVGERMNDHGKRLRVLEGFAKTATGAIAIIGFVVGWFKVTASVK
jgi:hypothetical protein